MGIKEWSLSMAAKFVPGASWLLGDKKGKVGTPQTQSPSPNLPDRSMKLVNAQNASEEIAASMINNMPAGKQHANCQLPNNAPEATMNREK